MLSWIGRFLNSSIGKKMIMALTGLCLIGFLFVHLAGNLTIYADDTGEAFRAYEHTLTSNPLLKFLEIGLLVLFVAHIALGLRVSRENRAARPEAYGVRANMGKRTPASGSMLITGLLIGLFLVVHILDFRIAKIGVEGFDMAAALKNRLATPIGAIIYLIGVTAVGLHISHAFRSAFQTLGLNHPKYTPLIEKLSLVIGAILFVGFASFPIFFALR